MPVVIWAIGGINESLIAHMRGAASATAERAVLRFDVRRMGPVWAIPSIPGRINRRKRRNGDCERRGAHCAIRPDSKRSGSMEKDSKATCDMVMAEKMEECADMILLHSKDRMLRVKGPFEAEHKAYMALALAALQTIQAFVALSKTLK